MLFRSGPSPFTDLGWFRSSAGRVPASSSETAIGAARLLTAAWTLGDIQCRLETLASGSRTIELRTARVFLDPSLTPAATRSITNQLTVPHPLVYFLHSDRWIAEIDLVFSDSQPILTYLANLLRAGTNTTPYSMVTAAGPPWTPSDMRDDEILVNQWLAEDLRMKPGDSIELSYFLPESGAKLTEATNTFRVRGVAPMEMP